MTPLWERVLQTSALSLGLVNGLMLLSLYLRDRAKLSVYPIHPDVYQWFFRLPGSEFEGESTRRFGFLCYVGIGNAGLRNVALDSWRLHVPIVGGTSTELRALSIPEPQIQLAGGTKVWPVLGVRGPSYDGETMVLSGGSIAGFAYYVYECYGHESWDPEVEGGNVLAKLRITSVFGKATKTSIVFRETPLHEAAGMVSGIETIGLANAIESEREPQ